MNNDIDKILGYIHDLEVALEDAKTADATTRFDILRDALQTSMKVSPKISALLVKMQREIVYSQINN